MVHWALARGASPRALARRPSAGGSPVEDDKPEGLGLGSAHAVEGLNEYVSPERAYHDLAGDAPGERDDGDGVVNVERRAGEGDHVGELVGVRGGGRASPAVEPVQHGPVVPDPDAGDGRAAPTRRECRIRVAACQGATGRTGGRPYGALWSLCALETLRTLRALRAPRSLWALQPRALRRLEVPHEQRVVLDLRRRHRAVLQLLCPDAAFGQLQGGVRAPPERHKQSEQSDQHRRRRLAQAHKQRTSSARVREPNRPQRTTYSRTSRFRRAFKGYPRRGRDGSVLGSGPSGRLLARASPPLAWAMGRTMARLSPAPEGPSRRVGAC